MFKRVFLHIGQSKTGTTSLQNFLSEHRDILTKNGILYPDFYSNGIAVHTKEHNPLAQALVDVQRYPFLELDDYFRQFEEQAKTLNCDTLFLSAEGFFGSPHIWTMDKPDDFFELHAQKIKRLKSYLGNADIHVLLYLRTQDDWFNSSVAQIIRYEGLLGKKIYQDDTQLFEFLKPHMDYVKLVNLWQSHLSPQKMSIIPFEKETLIQKNTIPDALTRLKLLDIFEKTDFEQLDDEHISLPHEAVLFKAKLNQTPCSKPVERVRNQICTQLAQHMGSGMSYQISYNLRQKIIQDFKQDNQALKKKFDFDGFVSDKKIKANNLDAQTLEDRLVAFDFAYHLTWPTLHTKYLIVKEYTKDFTRKKMPLLHGLLRKAKRKVS